MFLGLLENKLEMTYIFEFLIILFYSTNCWNRSNLNCRRKNCRVSIFKVDIFDWVLPEKHNEIVSLVMFFARKHFQVELQKLVFGVE